MSKLPLSREMGLEFPRNAGHLDETLSFFGCLGSVGTPVAVYVWGVHFRRPLTSKMRIFGGAEMYKFAFRRGEMDGSKP